MIRTIRPPWRSPRSLLRAVTMLVVLNLLPALVGCGARGSATGGSAGQRPGLDVLRLDYAYYSPVSLVLKHFGWVEEEFGQDGVRVEWVLSLGSNKANEHLAGGAVHFASTAGSAALLARANGVPLKTVWIFAQPEWTALVAPAGSDLDDAADLKGRTVAVTRGTDPYFFLLQALHAAGLSQHDVTIVHLQHPDGAAALLNGQVDAWAGLDPHMADVELKAGARLFFRRPEWNTYGFLNVREDFVARHPDVVTRVLGLYERGRQWVLAHPEETARILSEASGLPIEVARKVMLERMQFPDPRPGAAQRAVLERVAPLLTAERLVPDDADVAASVDALLDAAPAEQALSRAGGGN